MKRFLLNTVLSLVVVGCGPSPSQADTTTDSTGEPDGERVYYGLLHAHTAFSDGAGTPEQAYAKAATVDGVDFFAITEHNTRTAEQFILNYPAHHWSRKDGIQLPDYPALYAASERVRYQREWTGENGVETEARHDKSVIAAARDAEQSDFIPIYGQEVGQWWAGNHVNVFAVDALIPYVLGEYERLFAYLETLDGPPRVVQMNHPNVAEDLFWPITPERKRANDYGIDDYGGDFARLVTAADKFIVLIELLNGPALANRTFAPHFRYDRVFEDDYYFYLTQGFHISPSVGHDNHWRHWGDKTPARMGVYATDFTQEGLFAAMRANRTFATEDQDLRIELVCNGQRMGAVIEAEPGAGITCQAHLADPTDVTGYSVYLYRGEVAPQTVETVTWRNPKWVEHLESEPSSETLAFKPIVVGETPFFVYVRARQDDGDRVWSAPLWVNHPRRY